MNTKAIIQNAAFALFMEFPFDAITVQMILNKAEVSRKTFYKYYADKYELMTLFYSRYMDQNIRDNYNGHNWEEILINLYDFIEMNRPYFRNVNKVKGQGSFWEFLHSYSTSFYKSVKLHNEQRDRLTEEEWLNIIMIVEAQMAIFKLLVEDRISLDREAFANLLVKPMPDSYKEILVEEPFQVESIL